MLFPKIDLQPAIDPITRDTAFSVDGARYVLRFDYPAIYEFYKTMGVNPVIESIGANPAHHAALLFVGLLHHQPDVTSDLIKSWWNSGAMAAALTELTFTAFFGQMPDPEQAVAGQTPDPPPA